MLNAKLTRSYKSPKGNTVFVYAVTGNEESLSAFETAQGTNHRTDDTTGKPLFFTTRCFGDNGTLIITSNGKVVPDMSEFDKANSLAQQYGGNLGDQLARIASERLLGVQPASAPVPAPARTPDESGF
jgi:hypothetical protein